MAIQERETSPPLPPAIRQQLDALRAGIRRYVWLEGLAAMAVWLGVAFWGSMAIDWLFQPPKLVREVVLGVACIGLAVVLFRYILRRAFARLSDRNMATVLERQFPQLNDTLLTSVSLLDHPVESSEVNPQMLDRTRNLALQRLDSVPLSEVFNPMPLVRKVLFSLGLIAAVGLLAATVPKMLSLWFDRNLLLSDARWPRKIRLEAVGFSDGVARVAAGSNFEVRVQAFRGDTEIPVIPEKVDIRYGDLEGGSLERRTMKKLGQPATSSEGDEALMEYSFSFTGILNSKHFDVFGGDGSIYDLQLRVVPNPNLNLKLVCEYPSYMERAPLTIESAGGAAPVRVPVGSQITLQGHCDKPLEMLRIERAAVENAPAWHEQFEGKRLGPDRSGFTYSFVPFPGEPAKGGKAAAAAAATATADSGPAKPHEMTLQFVLRDADGLKARDPVNLTLVAVPDEPPEVKVRLVGTREPVVTPKGRLPVTGTINDDHGLARAWFSYLVEERALPQAAFKPSIDAPQNPAQSAKPPVQRSGEAPLADLPNHLAQYVVKEAEVTAKQLNLITGQRLSLAVKAADLCTFGNGPNVGSGETWQLDVVTEDELVTRLEARELLVKQRYEQIVEEMTETRNLLLKMDFSPPKKAGAVVPRVKQAGSEPGDRPEETPNFTLEELNKRRLERTLQSLQNCRKNASETADIVAAIEEIRLQLDNNQANNETRKQRIEVQVLQPLHQIVEIMFPVLDKRLVDLQGAVEDLARGPGFRDSALQQADLILAMMQNVLNHMKKAEDFEREVVQRLKDIIEKQKRLRIDTQKSEQDSLEK